jgi:hypothetical protein
MFSFVRLFFLVEACLCDFFQNLSFDLDSPLKSKKKINIKSFKLDLKTIKIQ